MKEVRLQKRPRSQLSVEQKVAFVLLMTLGFGGVILGFFSFASQIQRPFDMQLASAGVERVLSTDERDQAEVETQKNRDSDNDGLNDYDELNVYKTSPYLKDTDSDGFDDKTEIFSGNDPNCPQDTDCSYVTVEEVAEPAPPELPRQNPVFRSFEAEDQVDIENYIDGLSIDEVRALLLQQGVPQETIDKVSDEQLLELMQNAATEANEAVQTE